MNLSLEDPAPLFCWRCHRPGKIGQPLKRFERVIPSKEIVLLCTNPWGGCFALMKRTHPDFIDKEIEELEEELRFLQSENQCQTTG